MRRSYTVKRAFERIPTNINARFFYSRTLYTGIVTNLSKNGMFIKTCMCLPFKSKFEILLLLTEEVLKVPVEVVRLISTYDICEGMGIKLIEKPQNYLELVDTHKNA
jgi:hypothetical protein